MKNDLGNKEIMAMNLNHYMSLNGTKRKDICNALGYKYSTVSDWINAKTYPRIDKIELLAKYFNIDKTDLIEYPEDRTIEKVALKKNAKKITIPVLGSIPAGVPMEAIEDIKGYIDVEVKSGYEYFSLQVHGDSMFPKYIEGDIVVFRKQSYCESGDECAVFVDGYDATFKKIIKQKNGIILQPLNNEYEAKIFTDSDDPVTVIGKAVKFIREV